MGKEKELKPEKLTPKLPTKHLFHPPKTLRMQYSNTVCVPNQRTIDRRDFWYDDDGWFFERALLEVVVGDRDPLSAEVGRQREDEEIVFVDHFQHQHRTSLELSKIRIRHLNEVNPPYHIL